MRLANVSTMLKVGGFHNWFHYFHLELAGEINYLGHWEHVTFGGMGDGISFTFNWGTTPVGFPSFFIFKHFLETLRFDVHRDLTVPGAGAVHHLPPHQVLPSLVLWTIFL